MPLAHQDRAGSTLRSGGRGEKTIDPCSASGFCSWGRDKCCQLQEIKNSPAPKGRRTSMSEERSRPAHRTIWQPQKHRQQPFSDHLEGAGMRVCAQATEDSRSHECRCSALRPMKRSTGYARRKPTIRSAGRSGRP